MGDCPDVATLDRLFAGELASELRGDIVDHAAGCADCRALLEALIDPAVATTLGDEVESQPLGLRAGTVVDRYVIERRLGQGGMGVVYAARDPALGRGVAIKVLRAGAPAERLRREAQALARLSHPNVVAVHDVGEHAGQTFIAMALVDGDNLRRWLDTPRSIPDVLRVLRAAGNGIAAAHHAGLIHRDLKPDNIFVAHTGEVLVGDFGLARDVLPGKPDAHGVVDVPIGMTLTGMVLGTPAYMAPEQATGEATMASDQFSFAVTAWEALFNARPFLGTTSAALQAEIAAGSITLPEASRGVPSRIVAALERALAADPEARFPTFDALLAELAPRRRRWPWLVGAALIAGSLALAFARPGPRAETCEVDSLLDGVWGPSQRAAITQSASVTALDGYAKRWLAIRRELCVTRAELGPELVDARTSCLDRRRAAFEVVIREVATTADVASSLRTIELLPALDDCKRAAGASRTAVQQAQDAAVTARLMTLQIRDFARHQRSFDEIRAIVRDAERDGPDDLLIDALVFEATMLREAALSDQAEPILHRAIVVAERSRDDRGRIRASIELVDVLVRLSRLPDAHAVLDQTAAAIARVGNDRDLELDLVQARVAIAAAEEDHEGAVKLLEGYLAQVHGDDSGPMRMFGFLLLGRELAAAHHPAQAAAAFRELSALEEKLGIDDRATPESLDAEAIAAWTAGDFARGIELDERALAMVRSAPHSPAVEAQALSALAVAYAAAGAWLQLRQTAQAQLALLPDTADTRSTSGEALENIGVGYLYSGDPAHAIEPLRKALAIYRTLGPTIADGVNASIALSRALVETGKLHDARVVLEPLVPTLTTAPPWRRGTASFVLARILWDDGDDHDRGRARVLAADAERDLSESIGQLAAIPAAAASVRIVTQRLAELQVWRKQHL